MCKHSSGGLILFGPLANRGGCLRVEGLVCICGLDPSSSGAQDLPQPGLPHCWHPGTGDPGTCISPGAELVQVHAELTQCRVKSGTGKEGSPDLPISVGHGWASILNSHAYKGTAIIHLFFCSITSWSSRSLPFPVCAFSHSKSCAIPKCSCCVLQCSAPIGGDPCWHCVHWLLWWQVALLGATPVGD